MLAGSFGDVRVRRQVQAQGVNQLIEEHWDAVINLGFGGQRSQPFGDFSPAPDDDGFAIGHDELCQHQYLVVRAYSDFDRKPVQ